MSPNLRNHSHQQMQGIESYIFMGVLKVPFDIVLIKVEKLRNQRAMNLM